MPLTAEQHDFIGVPPHEGYDRPPQELRFSFRELSNDRVEIHHPFHETVIFGDGSAIDSRAMDAAGVVLFQELPYLVDAMKLNRTRPFETRRFGGEFSQLSHCASLAIISQEMGGGPLDILDGLFNDAGQIYDGHQGDDNYQGHGLESLHDYDRSEFFERAGVIESLVEAGAVVQRRDGLFVARTRLTLDKLLDEDEAVVRRSFLSNKHAARRLDADRFQYNEEERMFMAAARLMDAPDPARVPLAMANLSLLSIARKIVTYDDEGDQLLFTNEQAALDAAMDYVEHNTEHWCEPVQDLVNDLLNLAERYFFTCNHPMARQFQDFFPRDYLHTSATLMMERFAEVAKEDEVMAWLLDTAQAIAADQSSKSTEYQRELNPYNGPNPPEGVKLTMLEKPITEAPQARVERGKFILQLPHGKVRTINPRVTNGGGNGLELTEIFKDVYPAFSAERHQWIGDYEAQIHIEDSELALRLGQAFEQMATQWRKALAIRPQMPPTELRRHIDEANTFVKKRGKISN